MRRAEVWLADFGKSKRAFEFGKKRPVLIVQSDKLNILSEHGRYDHLMVAPVSTRHDETLSLFRPALRRRAWLPKGGFAVCHALCFVHKRHFIERLGDIDETELASVERAMREALGLII